MKERQQVAVEVEGGELRVPKSVVLTPPRETGWSTSARRSSSNSASTSATSIRQLAVPARNKSAPEQIGWPVRFSRERQSSSLAPQSAAPRRV